MATSYLATSALPYANGPIHMGHLVEYIQTDIWVRFKKMMGESALHMCADDAHGTPIMLSAKARGMTPEELIKDIHHQHESDLRAFGVDFDEYYTTHSEENKVLASDIYLKAKEKGAIYTKVIEQAYCNSCAMFLPDRFIKGTCPKCGEADQYGDNCERCSGSYATKDLVTPYCVSCKEAPITKESEHHFFAVSKYEETIKTWLDTIKVTDAIKNKLDEWFKDGLRDWDISRDAPYFGFEIPGEENKFFYVWLDAPVGYIATTQHYCEKNGLNVNDIWKDGDTEIHHFIGKDILYFHTLFWPAMLDVSGYKLPSKVNVHGFLTIGGKKMSKSRGTFITARTYLDHLSPEYLRYYYASKLTGGIDDIDFSFEDFVNKVNADIVNKVVNIGSRLGAILAKKCGGKLTSPNEEGVELLNSIRRDIKSADTAYDTLNTHEAMRVIISLAERVNKYVDEQEPWAKVKVSQDEAAAICTTGLNALLMLSVYLSPVLPQLTDGVFNFLNCENYSRADIETTIEDHPINPYVHLAQRVKLEDAQKIQN
jgi:methionyl-tRNA synthetase